MKGTSAATAKNPRHDAVLHLAQDNHAIISAYSKASFSAIQANTYITAVAAFTVISALCFGIDQGILPEIDISATQTAPTPTPHPV
jgi:hypothetical protein